VDVVVTRVSHYNPLLREGQQAAIGLCVRSGRGVLDRGYPPNSRRHHDTRSELP
jgi:hypothetical protein